MMMRWRKAKTARRPGEGPRGRLIRALGKRDRDKRLAAAEALLGEPLAAAEVAALCPVLEDLGSTAEGRQAGDKPLTPDLQEDLDLALRIVQAFGQARWRRALTTLAILYRQGPDQSPLRRAAGQALEAIQPGLTDPQGQASNATAELQPRVVMEKGLLARGGVPALRDYLSRMPLCGVFATAEIPRTPREDLLRTDRQHFGDRRLRRDPDASGTIDETVRRVVEGLYAITADLGKKSRATERSLIQPHTREGVPGLAEVRTVFGAEFGYVDLVARCDRDWFYYWGTEL